MVCETSVVRCGARKKLVPHQKVGVLSIERGAKLYDVKGVDVQLVMDKSHGDGTVLV